MVNGSYYRRQDVPLRKFTMNLTTNFKEENVRRYMGTQKDAIRISQ
jgi:hypothetical protein